jgi:chloramphenicol 3-O phosphotransferase
MRKPKRLGDGGSDMTEPGKIIVLNGAPRAGKSSIASALQETFDAPWMNLGVDVYSRHVTPARYRPGIGLRPGGERPDIESLVPQFYGALYESIAAHSRLGLNVVADVGHHDAYAVPRGILSACARRLHGLPAFLVGVRCPIEVIMARRNAPEAGREGQYVSGSADDPVPEVVRRWQCEVHRPGIYDVEVDTSTLSPAACAALIRRRMEQGDGPPTAFERLAAMSRLGAP